ncbi:MAG TPA: glycoside hydrolase family 16 protein [Bacteroidales bacterium]|nr:glycoside hydrolase family 16 protein [Bacteroidales bacterium]
MQRKKTPGKISGFISPAFLFAACLAFSGCGLVHHKPVPDVDLPGEYVLIFQDEFNGQALDTAIWGFHNLGKRRSAVNLKEACLLNGKGKLEIRNWTAVSGNDTIHHAGMIETKQDFTFGYYEARIKFDIEMGSWGAFWIMYHNFRKTYDETDNPKDDGVEIDIMEFVPTKGRYGCHNLHWNGYREFHKKAGSDERMNGKLEGYHIYSLLWTEEGYIFYIDGEESWRYNEGISYAPEYIILSTEILDGGWAGDVPAGGYGTFGGTKNIMYVDYVRVFQEL